ncbi:MAG: tRNA (adenosine(37)-N6)-threonylcarbamoyltransferase complex transferase subunit TsaD [Proteobacteria bacterium]|nr:tRNA (adenosine(37)-N6)-threonylcarbamoyltransferase complex transferase subunit TsaD [Pseudomonadota bacterium]NBP15264.1 tRNA (adenosine(37)-N6)-threonylcarbamoyltransferase complex transferase subunit TsaD [bacterium]
MHELILALETSCDETAAAVFDTQKGMLSNVLYSQIELHKNFGGVVPEIASRAHIEKINEIVSSALTTANVTLDQITTIGVTSKPGLPGSLLVGCSFAKAMAGTLNKKIIAIDHLEGHAFSANIEHEIPFPFLCITASGGHTSMYLIKDFGDFTPIGTTADDAAGEAFDKIAKLLELGYPGGPIIEKRAASQNFQDFFKYPRGDKKSLNFSFSGLKTAVLYDLVKQGAYDLPSKTLLNTSEELKNHVASSLQVCIADIFAQKVLNALQVHPELKAVSFVGGVACNKYIRAQLKILVEKTGRQFFVPHPQYCTDNAGMIAFVTHYKAQRNQFSDLTFDIL